MDTITQVGAAVGSLIVIVTGVGWVVGWQVDRKLMRPNGGHSVADVANKLDLQGAHIDALHDRLFRVERTLDQVVIPRQSQIYHATVDRGDERGSEQDSADLN